MYVGLRKKITHTHTPGQNPILPPTHQKAFDPPTPPPRPRAQVWIVSLQRKNQLWYSGWWEKQYRVSTTGGKLPPTQYSPMYWAQVKQGKTPIVAKFFFLFFWGVGVTLQVYEKGSIHNSPPCPDSPSPSSRNKLPSSPSLLPPRDMRYSELAAKWRLPPSSSSFPVSERSKAHTKVFISSKAGNSYIIDRICIKYSSITIYLYVKWVSAPSCFKNLGKSLYCIYFLPLRRRCPLEKKGGGKGGGTKISLMTLDKKNPSTLISAFKTRKAQKDFPLPLSFFLESIGRRDLIARLWRRRGGGVGTRQAPIHFPKCRVNEFRGEEGISNFGNGCEGGGKRVRWPMTWQIERGGFVVNSF